jgi:hypothetical protein
VEKNGSKRRSAASGATPGPVVLDGHLHPGGLLGRDLDGHAPPGLQRVAQQLDEELAEVPRTAEHGRDRPGHGEVDALGLQDRDRGAQDGRQVDGLQVGIAIHRRDGLRRLHEGADPAGRRADLRSERVQLGLRRHPPDVVDVAGVDARPRQDRCQLAGVVPPRGGEAVAQLLLAVGELEWVELRLGGRHRRRPGELLHRALEARGCTHEGRGGVAELVGEARGDLAEAHEPRLLLRDGLVDLRALDRDARDLGQDAGARPEDRPEGVGREAHERRRLDRRARRRVRRPEDEDELGEHLAGAERHGMDLPPADPPGPPHPAVEDEPERVGRVALPGDHRPRAQLRDLAELREPRQPLLREVREDVRGAQAIGQGRHARPPATSSSSVARAPRSCRRSSARR